MERTAGKQRRFPLPALVLFFLAPAVGELLSGSAPPVEFCSPFTLLLLAALYGSGAVLARELTRRWDKGWPTLLALGVAYGIVEEGLMVKSFFDPDWMDIGLLGSYGRWAGVNWVWTVELTIFHAAFSIAIPIMLVELAFPARRTERWVGRGTLVFLTLLLSADVLLGFLALTAYRPPFVPYALAVLAVAGLIWLARRLPKPAPPRPGPDARPARPLWFGLAGFWATLALFFLSWAVPNMGVPAVVTLALMLLLAGGTGFLIWRLARSGTAWGDAQQWALTAGALSFFVLLAPLQELDRTRPDNPAGMTCVGLLVLLLLVALAWRVRRRSRARAGAQISPQSGRAPEASSSSSASG